MPIDFFMAAARYRLGLVDSQELKALANQALEEASYTPSLAELATMMESAISECGPVFEAALAELGVPIPSEEEATLYLIRHYISDIADGRVSPRQGMRVIVKILHKTKLHSKSKKYLGDSYELENILGEYYSYDDLEERPLETSYEGKRGQEALQMVDDEIVRLARIWLKGHGA